MECRNIKDLLSYYLEGDLESGEQEEIKMHLKGCAVCQKEFALLKAAVQSVRDMEKVRVPANLLDKINQRIDGMSFSQQFGLIWQKISFPNFSVPVKCFALAASILIILSLYLAVGPGQVYFSKSALEGAKTELAIPKPAGNIPRPGSYCIAPAKMAEARAKIISGCEMNLAKMVERQNFPGSYFPAPDKMAKVREVIGN